jgi:nucleotide-binding universal stress UspA family protein
MFKRVLVTLDGSSISEAVLPEAARLLRGTEAEVHLLTVAEVPRATAAHPEGEPLTVGVPAPGAVVRMEVASTLETKAQAISRVTDELREFLIAEAEPFDRVAIRYHTAVRFGYPAEEILGYAEKEKVDLVMMATHGHTGLARLVFGSVASRVVASGVCPVLLVRPDKLKQDLGETSRREPA